MSETTLDDLLAPEMERVEEMLRAATGHVEGQIAAPASHLAEAGGKRLRPMLALLGAQLGTGVNEEVRQAAVAVELTHLATLYHDDVMDSAPLRRGALAAHQVWGNSVAILTGDLLFARASRIVAELGPEAVKLHAVTFERLCLGQLHETMGPLEGVDAVEHYIDVLADKTGSLIAASARYGAMFADSDPAYVVVMERFGEKVGIAFQLADDVIDLESDSAVTGKTPGTDLREGVDTMPILLLRVAAEAGTLDEAGREILARLDGTGAADGEGASTRPAEDAAALGAGDSKVRRGAAIRRDSLQRDDALAAVVEALRVHPVLEQAREMARSWAADAVAELESLPAGEVRKSLYDFADALVDRLA
ncbi:MAG: polyprenyl synthetase family protein [Ruaniaceae bacterium]|nr:polyprenyl synthetase family protein [Ruaniaceae bacterium]